MILLNFIYKGAIVETQSFSYIFTQRNCAKIHQKLVDKEIKVPENYDRYTLTQDFIKELYVG